jgi:hypothetical protein
MRRLGRRTRVFASLRRLCQFFENVDLRLISDDEIAGAHVGRAGAQPFALAATAIFAFAFECRFKTSPDFDAIGGVTCKGYLGARWS